VDGSDAGRTAGVPPGARRIPSEVWDARQAARSLLAGAEEQARRIKVEAEREAEGIRTAAFEAGFAAGRAEGIAGAAAEVVRGAAERERLLAGAAEELLDLAVEMAARILDREVRPGVDGLTAAARALTLVRDSPRVALRASQEDAAALREGGFSPGAGITGMRVVVDPGLRTGEVIVEADGASVDGRFRAQLAELRRVIAQAER
jgi:flagellar biosynthesis/type III secretory pathway protein FliH